MFLVLTSGRLRFLRAQLSELLKDVPFIIIIIIIIIIIFIYSIDPQWTPSSVVSA
jgi:hypothetical protein